MLQNEPLHGTALDDARRRLTGSQYYNGAQASADKSYKFAALLRRAVGNACRPPTQIQHLTYAEFLEKAKASLTQPKVDMEHFYLQLSTGLAHTCAQCNAVTR